MNDFDTFKEELKDIADRIEEIRKLCGFTYISVDSLKRKNTVNVRCGMKNDGCVALSKTNGSFWARTTVDEYGYTKVEYEQIK